MRFCLFPTAVFTISWTIGHKYSVKSIVVFRCKVCIAASNQPHFQMINRKIQVSIFFKHFSCQHRLTGMRCTCNQYNHIYERLTILSKKSNAIDTTPATNSPIEIRLKRLYILYVLAYKSPGPSITEPPFQ